MNDIGPILATLRRHKLIATLLALLVALTCAIVCNVAFMIQQHTVQLQLPSGVAEKEVTTIQEVDLGHGVNQLDRHREDLLALREIPGVTAAAAMDTLPLGGDNQSTGTCNSNQALVNAGQSGALPSSCADPSMYDGSPGVVKALGLRLIAGRNFRADEFVDANTPHDPPVAIITQALAEKLYPHGNALGKALYTDPGQPIRIVGIVANVIRPYLHNTVQKSYCSMIWPMRPQGPSVTYVLRSSPTARASVMAHAQAALYRVDRDRVVSKPQSFTQLRAAYFQNDRTMVGLLLASALGLMLVAALGIAGLANFWVQQRTRSIGIRRALGATRANILAYFQMENFLIVTVGVALGVVFALGLNLLLMAHYQQPRLPLWYLPVGAAALCTLGQLAVLAPALRASRLPPAVAVRGM